MSGRIPSADIERPTYNPPSCPPTRIERVIDPPEPNPPFGGGNGSGGRSGGFGNGPRGTGGLGALGTIAEGAYVAGKGITEVVKYCRRVEQYLDENGNWY